MPMVALKQKRAAGAITKKRRGQHHRLSKQYHKVYWPYVPIVAIIALGSLYNKQAMNISRPERTWPMVSTLVKRPLMDG